MAFPFKHNLRLSTIIGYWELQQYEDNAILAETAKSLVKKIDEHPFLRGPIDDVASLEPVKDIVSLIISAVVPPAVSNDQIMAVFKPFSLEYFYSTTPFQKLVKEAGSLLNMAQFANEEELEMKKTMSAFHAVLHQFYGVELPKENQMVMQLDREEGTTSYYHLFFDPRFCEVKLLGDKAPELTREEIDLLVRENTNVELWNEKLPPELFEFTGFAIYTLVEATHQEALTNIKDVLQSTKEPSEEMMEYFKKQVRDLTQVPDLECGISSYHTFKQVYDRCDEGGSMSLLVDDQNHFLPAFHQIANDIKGNGEAVIVPDTSESDYFKNSPKKFKSFMAVPLFADDDFIGHLELGSNLKSLDPLVYARILDLVPILANAISKRIEETENKIQSIIKEYYTSIHPAVEWKFVDAAFSILEQQMAGKKEIQEEVVFKNVYPLFASSDIRGSSTIRNQAILSDLIHQLEMAQKSLTEAERQINFPIVGETVYRLNKQLKRLKKGGLLSGDEQVIVQLLQNDIEPTIKDLEKDLPELRAFTKEHYWDLLDPELGIYYHERRKFEESITKMNDAISTFIDTEEARAQAIFPHYFEKYKTDGVEYNIYVGDAIARNKKFNNLYLKNLRLWQLLVTVETARITQDLKDSLSMPLEAGHLILVHSQPLSVKFKMDEKQFDVDGAYNIRYEIIKKRIDKVHIKDTDERLTQPNTISIIYNHEEEAREYLSYLEYLRHEGHITPQFEQFELEELQGVSGLKAFRVRLEKTSKSIMKELHSLGIKGSASLAS